MGSPMSHKTQAVEQCRFTKSDGRRCRMPAVPGPDLLCPMHLRRSQREADAVAAELFGPFREFKTATAVNHALGKLSSLVARGRIPVRNAVVLAYISQLLLNSLRSVQREAP